MEDESEIFLRVSEIFVHKLLGLEIGKELMISFLQGLVGRAKVSAFTIVVKTRGGTIMIFLEHSLEELLSEAIRV